MSGADSLYDEGLVLAVVRGEIRSLKGTNDAPDGRVADGLFKPVPSVAQVNDVK